MPKGEGERGEPIVGNTSPILARDSPPLPLWSKNPSSLGFTLVGPFCTGSELYNQNRSGTSTITNHFGVVDSTFGRMRGSVSFCIYQRTGWGYLQSGLGLPGKWSGQRAARFGFAPRAPSCRVGLCRRYPGPAPVGLGQTQRNGMVGK